jgi:hypothetical protein
MPEKLPTWEQKRLKRINELKRKLQAAEKRFDDARRKKRNAELIAFGVLVEELFKAGDSAVRQKWLDDAKKHLSTGNLFSRAESGFERLKELLTPSDATNSEQNFGKNAV